MMRLSERQKEALNKMFEKIKDNLKTRNKKISFLFLSMSQRNRQKLLKESALNENELNLSNIEQQQLIDAKLLTPISLSTKTYSLSLKGIIIKEFDLTNMDPKVEQFLNELNYEYLDKSKSISKMKLKDTEKTLLFLMLCLKTVSDKIYLDLENKLFEIKEAYEITANFLYKNNFIRTDPTKNYSSAKGEDPFRATLRRLNNLPLKTEHIYFSGQNKAYLDILSESDKAKNKVEFVLKKILEKDKLTFEDKMKILRFARKLYEEFAHKIFEPEILSSKSIDDFERKLEKIIMVKL